MKFYVDEDGNKYSVDRETGEQTLVQPAAAPTGEASAPIEPADIVEE